MDLNQDMKPSHTQVQENGIIFLSMHSIDYNVVDNKPRRRWGRWAPPLTPGKQGVQSQGCIKSLYYQWVGRIDPYLKDLGLLSVEMADRADF